MMRFISDAIFVQVSPANSFARAATIGAAGAKLLAGMAWTKTASEMKRIITAV